MNYYYATDIKEAIKELRRDIKERRYQTLEREAKIENGFGSDACTHRQ